MRKYFYTVFSSITILFASAQPTDYSKLVNPFIGTGGHGHTFPGATVPFGMVQVSPDTRLEGWDGCSGYHYSNSVIYGFSHTHLSGTGCSDYGDVMIMPMMGQLNFDNKVYSSTFSHSNEKAHAGFYTTHLNDPANGGIDVKLTSSTRVAFHEYTFNKSGEVHFILDLLHRDKLLEGKVRVINKNTIEGFRRSEAWASNQQLYFRIEFSKAMIHETYQINGSNETEKASRSAFTFNVKKGESISVKVSLSAVDYEGAKKNMEAEIPHWNFEKVKQEAEDLWNKELSKIEVKGGTHDQQVIFYTALYHSFIQPNTYSDVDGRYRGRDMKIHQADSFTYYTVFSLWDTFRAAHPLYNIIQRKRNSDFIKTFLKQYEQGGRLPVWELSSNETDCMIGYNSVSVIADAYAKGNRDFDLNLAAEAAMKSATWNHLGLPVFNSLGYLSIDDESESVSKTLEYSYDAWCVAKLLKALQRTNQHHRFIEHSQGWKNIFDPSTGFMRPRKNGGWLTPFDPREVNNHFTEANSWQYSFFVPHDIERLIQMHGGHDAFEKKLDELFNTSNKTTGRDQADITGLVGQYAHGNEPSHHMAFLYNYAGKPEKTQYRVNQILTEMYHNAPDGLAGNEDCGQMSAWYVMSAMGFYAVCPGTDEYQVSAPLFDEVKIHSDKNTITILSPHRSEKDIYISSLSINGKPNSLFHIQDKDYPTSGFRHDVFNESSLIKYELTDTASTLFNTNQVVSFKAEMDNYIPAPVITAAKQTFKDSLLISISTLNTESGSEIEYFIEDKNSPKTISPVSYTKPFYIHETSKIHASSKYYGNLKTHSTEAYFQKIENNWTVQLTGKYNTQYSGGGDDAIIDGLYGDTDWRKGKWQGYQAQDFEAIIDLKKEMTIKTIVSNFLQDTRSWIIFPKQVEYYISNDGKNFMFAGKIENTIAANDLLSQLKKFEYSFNSDTKTRFLKVKAKNFGTLPSWHQGAGGEAFIFIDEIEVK